MNAPPIQDLSKSEIHQPFKDMVGFQSVMGALPIHKAIAPVITADPPINYSKSTSGDITGTLSVLTVPNLKDKDFYLLSFEYAYFKDAACDVATGFAAFQVVINGANVSLMSIPLTTTTAEKNMYVFNLPRPLKLDKGSQISVAGSFTAGVYQRRATVHGVLL